MVIKTKNSEVLSVEEAMENLALMVSIDLENPPSVALLPRKRLAVGEKRGAAVRWLSSEGEGPIVDVVDMTYQIIYQHIMSLIDKEALEEGGVAPLMALISESAQKMEAYLVDRIGHPLQTPLVELASYQELKRLYREWSAAKKEEGQELESIRRDRDYELFVIRKENGRPYFDVNLLKHVKMVCGFEGGALEDDPLLRIRSLIDRDLQTSARQMLTEVYPWLQKYYALPKEVKQHALAQRLGMALLALFLASNPQNLIQNCSGKSSLQYFEDFHQLLRSALETSEYKKWIAYSLDMMHETNICMQLAHELCHSLFYRLGGIKQELLGFIHRMMHQGESRAQLPPDSSWLNRLLIEDQSLRTLLVEFPNGPLFKILDLVRLGTMGFDPIGQDNRPLRLYQMKKKGRHIDLLRMPSPTRQVELPRVEVIEEFYGFLQSLKTRGGKHLLINLQDRTSWKEENRALALEALGRNAEYNQQLVVVTIPKDGEFYHQTGSFLNTENARVFIDSFKKEMKKNDSGWFFPKMIWDMELETFIDQTLTMIHAHFFHHAKQLSRKNREDFIELFQQFVILYLIDRVEPMSVSFTCKDGVDVGAMEGAVFFAFLMFLSGKTIHTTEEIDFLRLLMYAPALLVRERGVDAECFYRGLSVMEHLNVDLVLAFQEIKHCFSTDFLKTLSVLPFLHSLK